MNIAVIGTGNVGRTLGTRWARAGHRVVFGSRHPESQKIQQLLADVGDNACADAPDEAVVASDVVVLATPWDATEDAVRNAGDLTGKIVVDCTNPLRPDLSGLSLGHDTSAAEQVAAWATGAHVVKAFNTTGTGNMAAPRYGEAALTMFVCGDDAGARAKVAALAEDLGFEAADAGPLRAARYLEPLAMLWIHLAYAQGFGPDFGFKLLRRPAP